MFFRVLLFIIYEKNEIVFFNLYYFIYIIMKRINNYNQYIFEQITNVPEMEELFNVVDILESIVTDSDALLKSIEAKEVDIYTELNINKDKLKNNLSIQELYDNELFNHSLEKNNYKKNELESTDESETFIDDTVQIKFFSIYKSNQTELDQPKFIVYQSKNPGDNNWSAVVAYSVNGDMQNFYNKLTNKTIEIKKNDKTYVYITSNSGNDWQLQKHQDNQDNKIFKDMMSNNDIKVILVDDDISITIIA